MYKSAPHFSANFIKISKKRFQNFFITSTKLIIFNVTLIFIHNFPRINTEFPWSFHKTLLPNINILNISTKSVKNFKNFLNISTMFSTINQQQFFSVFPISFKMFEKLFQNPSAFFQYFFKVLDIFSKSSFNNFTNCF